MKPGLFLRTILYMLIAVWVLFFMKAVNLQQAYAMSIGVLAGSLIGYFLTKFLRKK